MREGCRARHGRYGRTVYLLEPDAKHGRGGLRDVQALRWSARILHDARTLSSAAEAAGAHPEEAEALREAVDVVLRVRVALHLLRGRFANDRLTFHLQEKIARRFGLEDSPGESGRQTLAVEHFMRRYYSAAGLLSRLSLQWQDIWLLPPPDPRPVALSSGLCVRQGHVDLLRRTDKPAQEAAVHAPIEVSAPAGEGVEAALRVGPGLGSLEEEALARLRRNPISVYEAALDLGLPLHPVTEAHMARVALLLDDGRITPAWRRSLRRVLCSVEGADELVRSLASSGLLVRMLSDFEPVIGLGKHDVYHIYTVDAHLLGALERGRALLRGDWIEEGRPGAAFFTRLAQQMPSHRRDVWLLSCLLHDVGKGRGGDHSEIGARLMGEVGPQLHLTGLEQAHLAFLILEHLLMPRISQRRDLSDREIIEAAALKIRTLGALDDLTLLAAVDMEAVGPQNLSEWKARLLIELHQRVRVVLEKGLGALHEGAARTEARRALGAALCLGRGVSALDEATRAAVERFFDSLPLRQLLGTPTEALARHFEVFASPEPVAVAFHQDEQALATEVAVCVEDRPGLLSTVSGVLSAHGLNILRAHISTHSSGRALDVFVVQTALGEGLTQARRQVRLAEDLRRAAMGQVSVSELLSRRRSKLSARPAPEIKTTVQVDQAASSRYTIFEVKTRDQVGLLWSISRSLYEAGCAVHIAKIVTEGERVIDAFYVEHREEGRKLDNEEAEAVRGRLLDALGQGHAD